MIGPPRSAARADAAARSKQPLRVPTVFLFGPLINVVNVPNVCQLSDLRQVRSMPLPSKRRIDSISSPTHLMAAVLATRNCAASVCREFFFLPANTAILPFAMTGFRS